MAEKKSIDIETSDKNIITLYQLGLKDALWIGSQFSKVAANPTISPLIDYMQLPDDKKLEIASDYSKIFQQEDIKEKIVSFIHDVANNYELIFQILETILKEAKIKIISDSGNKTEDFTIENLTPDDLDLIYDIIVAGIKLNYSVGLKKVGKKLGFLE